MVEAGRGGDGGSGGGGSKEVLFGKGLEMMDKFSGGEAGWNEWSGDFRTMVQTKSEAAGEALIYIKVAGKAEKEVMDWEDVVESKKDDAKKNAEEEMYTDEVVGNKVKAVEENFKDLGKVSKELYRWLRLKTEGEAKLVVLAEEDEGDGIKIWGLLHANYNKKTMSRLMRLQQESMYPRAVKTMELVGAIMAWEDKWKKMIRDQPEGTKIPDLWKMAAMLKLCPKEIQDMVELRWDEIGEEYQVLRERVIGWATTKTEKRGGAVPMDVDGVDGSCRGDRR